MSAHLGHVMTLANSIIGVGILAMPFCFQKCGIVLSIILLITSNWITRICCHYLIKSSLLTRRKSFEFLGFHAFGSSGKLLVELCIIGYLLGTCITYLVVVGDLGPQIVTKMFELEHGPINLRTIIMVAVTLFCILPLGMLKNVDSLSTVCACSIGFYICLVFKIVLESEEHILANDWTEKVVYWEPAGVLQCLPIFGMALSCQMQLFEVFESVNNQSLEKLNGIVRSATWICTFVYIAVGFFGYVAFCTQPFAGNILMNFSQSFGSDVIKIGFILSVAFSFPLVIFPCRASIYSLLYRKGHSDATAYIPETRFKLITIFIVCFALCIALIIPSVELIIGLVGSTIGVAICIMFPASCFRKIVKKPSTERTSAQFILVCGFCLMILGTYANLGAIDEKSSGAHLDTQNLEESIQLPADLPLLKTKHELLASKEESELKSNEKSAKKLNLNGSVNVAENAQAPSPPSPPPPLPVDEKHREPLNDKKLDKPDSVKTANAAGDGIKVISPLPDVVKHIPVEDINKSKRVEVPQPPSSDAAKIKAEEIAVSKIQHDTQNIDKEALKSNDKIAAEESKSNKEQQKKDDVLKKTQDELRITKDLLARKVDELKVELAKQNQETQNFVVEKLGEVVEKVEQIEREVNKEKQLQTVELLPNTKKDVVKNEVQPDILEKRRIMNSPLLSILSDAGHAQEEAEAHKRVYEPLSYKTGEYMDHTRNNSKGEARLALPFALLINSTHAKYGEQTKETDEATKLKLPNPSIVNEVKYENAAPAFKKPAVVTKETSNAETAENRMKLETIRRDILQVEESKEKQQTAKEKTSKITAPVQRVKRSNDAATLELEVINQRISKENYLKAPKMETLMAHSLSASLEFNHIAGRKLKALKEKNNSN